MSESEVKEFLTSKVNVQIATVDSKGDPSIQPVWYYYDQNAGKFYINTAKASQKVRNIRRRDTVYFSIDEDVFPYRCVKGKAKANVLEDAKGNLPIAERIMEKYLGSIDEPVAKQILDTVKSGDSVLVEMTPSYYSAWDFGKQ
jgi:nitroimidazol reductase NimA-like FMN-containing flavoprotein (pyridoxamine 5'-phosphate oxidase superfamily)